MANVKNKATASPAGAAAAAGAGPGPAAPGGGGVPLPRAAPPLGRQERGGGLWAAIQGALQPGVQAALQVNLEGVLLGDLKSRLTPLLPGAAGVGVRGWMAGLCLRPLWHRRGEAPAGRAAVRRLVRGGRDQYRRRINRDNNIIAWT
jgi:hypothetical protein